MIRAAAYFPIHQRRLGGGDWVQVQQTLQALHRSKAAHVDLFHSLPGNLGEYDLLHVFNLLRAEDLIVALAAGYEAKIPVVLSSIYWDDTDYRTQGRWKLPDPQDPLGRLALQLELQRLSSDMAARGAIVSSLSGIAALSQSELDLICQQFDPAPKAIKTVVHNGIDPLFFHGDPERFSSRYGLKNFILTVGRIEDRKNQLRAIHAVQAMGMPLVVVGRPFDQLDYYRACREAAGKDVLFIDSMTPQELADAYAAAAAFVLPSWLDPAPLVCLEAAAAGCPVVTSRYGGIAEYLDGLCWLCEPGSVDSIRAALEKAVEAQGARRDISHVARKFTWDVSARETLDLYLAVVKLRPVGEPSWLPWLRALEATLDADRIQRRLAGVVSNHNIRISYQRNYRFKLFPAQKDVPFDLRGELSFGPIPSQVRRGELIKVAVSLQNRGNDVWPDAERSPWPVNVGYQWRGSKGIHFEGRCLLPEPIRPHEKLEWEDVLSAPNTPGQYSLLIALVHEDHAWSNQVGGPSLTFAVEVV